jgi:transcriptional accessory protein Tex/SPT6
MANSGDKNFTQRIPEIKSKILKVLRFLRSEKFDVPYITRYRQDELIPDLQPEDVWKIFNLDIEYGKFQVQKK